MIAALRGILRISPMLFLFRAKVALMGDGERTRLLVEKVELVFSFGRAWYPHRMVNREMRMFFLRRWTSFVLPP